MINSTEGLPFRRAVFTAFVLFVFGTSTTEIIVEFADGESLESMVDDLLRFTVSTIVIGVFAHEHHAQRKALGQLREQLSKARGRLGQVDGNSHEVANQYRAVVQKQFDAWQLTESEQDVVIGILKGLSFRQIAGLRETREKTVRQQASSVYRKAGVSSRNELTAWFFEDMLEPPVLVDPHSIPR